GRRIGSVLGSGRAGCGRGRLRVGGRGRWWSSVPVRHAGG
ncbi:hypothetical protein Airi02_015350, partial [Actinoallomurus iriomotensis]